MKIKVHTIKEPTTLKAGNYILLNAANRDMKNKIYKYITEINGNRIQHLAIDKELIMSVKDGDDAVILEIINEE